MHGPSHDDLQLGRSGCNSLTRRKLVHERRVRNLQRQEMACHCSNFTHGTHGKGPINCNKNGDICCKPFNQLISSRVISPVDTRGEVLGGAAELRFSRYKMWLGRWCATYLGGGGMLSWLGAGSTTPLFALGRRYTGRWSHRLSTLPCFGDGGISVYCISLATVPCDSDSSSSSGKSFGLAIAATLGSNFTCCHLSFMCIPKRSSWPTIHRHRQIITMKPTRSW